MATLYYIILQIHTRKSLLLHCLTMLVMMDVIFNSIVRSSVFTSSCRVLASDVSVDKIFIILNIRSRNAFIKSLNFAVDRQTSFSIYSSRSKKICNIFLKRKLILTSVRSLRVCTADEQSTQVISMKIVLRNSNVTVVFLKSFKSIPGKTVIIIGNT